MDEKTKAQVTDDFLCWSGGFAPESELEIDTFVRNARDQAIDENEVRGLLLEWLQAELDGRHWPFLPSEQGDDESKD